MPGKAAKVRLSEKQMDILRKISREATASVRLVQRSRIILLGFEGLLNEEIAREVSVNQRQVGRWRRRWQESFDALISIECSESMAALRSAIEEVLSDAPRAGSPGTFSAEQVTQIIAIACESPANSGRPINYWTAREIADEAQKRGVVKSISARQVSRYLKAAALQPHRCRYWLNTKEKDPDVFQAQVEIVCQTYLEAPELYFQHHTHTVSTDEMTSIQALERTAEPIPMQPNHPERIESEYKRHSTVCLMGNWEVVEGQMIAPTIRATRTNTDFLWHIAHTIQTDPDANWVFLVDRLNIHCSEELVKYVADIEKIAQSTLGQKNRCGILKSMASRQEFLSDKSHRVRFVYLPLHSSWLNQIERIFGIVRGRVLRRGSFHSTAELKHRMQEFITYFNNTFATPFDWTYTGRPLTTKRDSRPKTWKEKWAAKQHFKKTSLAMAH